MSPTGAKSSSRAIRLIGWTLGTVGLLALLGYLAVAGSLLWLFGVSLPAGQRAKAEAERQMAQEAAAEAQNELAAAAADGSLPDEEIRKVVGTPRWDVERTDAVWRLRVLFPAMDPVCYSYEITLPLGTEARVTSSELPTCSDIGSDR